MKIGKHARPVAGTKEALPLAGAQRWPDNTSVADAGRDLNKKPERRPTMISKIVVSAAAASLTLPSAANAATYMFDLSGEYSARWMLDSNPTPVTYTPNRFVLSFVQGDFPGSTLNYVDLTFRIASGTNDFGGLLIEDSFGRLDIVDMRGT